MTTKKIVERLAKKQGLTYEDIEILAEINKGKTKNMSNKINDEIADQAIDIVNQLIEDKEIAEEQRDTYLDKVYKSLLEDEQTRIFNKFRD